jgi:hypothetical protein
VRRAPEPSENPDPRPENTAGVFLEHFDLGPPEDGPLVTNRVVETGAREAAAAMGWSYRSYSSGMLPAGPEDFHRRRITSFPQLILFRDGVELGRWVISLATKEHIVEWANRLLSNAPIVGPKAPEHPPEPS